MGILQKISRSFPLLVFFAIIVLIMLGACGRQTITAGATPVNTPQPGVPAVTRAPVAQHTALANLPTITSAPASTEESETIPSEDTAQPAQSTIRVALPTITLGPALTQQAGWNQLGGNPQRTHYVDANLPARRGAVNEEWRVLWVWNGSSGDSGPTVGHLFLPKAANPIVGDGRIYIGDDGNGPQDNGSVLALNAASGSVAWSRPLEGKILDSGAYDSATGAVFFASTNGRLYKLNAATGAIVNSFDAGAEIRQAVLLVGDTVYIGTMAGNLYAVNTTTMEQRWVYNAGAALLASSAYATKNGGLIIFPGEDKYVHAVRASDGTRAWRTLVNTNEDPRRENRRFPDTFPVVAESADAVIIRSYFSWDLTWLNGGAPATVAQSRTFLSDPTNEEYQSFFVLDLDDGQPRFVAPVFAGGIGNGGDYYSTPPQAVVKRLPDGSDVAYLFWRTRTSCRGYCDGREDTTIGEMNLTTGDIRFIQDYRNEGTMRFPSDEQGAFSMVGNVLFHSHWMSLGAINIPDRTLGGTSFTSPIPSEEYLSVSNSVQRGQCTQRISAQRFCPEAHHPPALPDPPEGQLLDPGFYIYYHSERVYDLFFTPPVRGPIYDGGVLYWKSVDGAIIALAPNGTTPPSPSSEPSADPSTEPSADPSTEPSADPSTEPSPDPSTSPAVDPTPTGTPVGQLQSLRLGLPMIFR